ncbi:anti-adapter protein IraP [Cronobacter dublinensis]|uniref:anti-adapter protein IraP n=1 Tax=Cronobacter dublinensis TaxID=413497 RepID=UPI0024C354CD|nr:anti-adapter protein IraP [Cronobacter dublinensis]MDK1198620.1 anti-adapter protein IraP [Cronobacter dublinensis]
MKNVIYSMLAKISKMDAEAKQLTAQVEAQSLLLSAMLITIGKGGSFEEMVEAVKQAINAALDAEDNTFKSETTVLLSQFNALLSIAVSLDKKEPELDVSRLLKLTSSLSSDKGL